MGVCITQADNFVKTSITVAQNAATSGACVLPEGVTDVYLDIPARDSASTTLQVLSGDASTYANAFTPGDSAVSVVATVAAGTTAFSWNVSKLVRPGGSFKVVFGANQTTALRTIYVWYR